MNRCLSRSSRRERSVEEDGRATGPASTSHPTTVSSRRLYRGGAISIELLDDVGLSLHARKPLFHNEGKLTFVVGADMRRFRDAPMHE
jgi:hypothetical protein